MPYKDPVKQRAHRKKRMRKVKKAWKTTHGPCQRCGATKDLYAHHVPIHPGKTHHAWDFGVATREVILSECIVLCRACHKKAYTPPVVHGTYAGYKRGCRCIKCTEAKRKYNREYMGRWRQRTGKH